MSEGAPGAGPSADPRADPRADTRPDPAAPPLAGLRVLDLSRILAGPWATQTLADLGADVVKVERPGRGDDTRGWGPPWIEREEGRDAAYFHAANRSKRSVAIDLASGEGADRVRVMARRADVVVENFPLRPGADGPVHSLRHLGLDPASLRALNPRLVVCSITGYGHDGPRATELGYDAMIQAASGHMSITGAPDGPPQKIGVALMDVMTGLYAATAIQAALLRRERTGRGDHVDLALYDVALATLANQAMNRIATGRDPGRLGTAHPSIVPYQGFGCADGEAIIAAGNDTQHARLCALLGRPELAEGPFATNAGRVEGRDTLVPALAGAIGGWRRDDLLAACAAAAVPAGPINGIGEALADPQAVHRGMVAAADGVALVRTPVRFAEADTVPPRRPPALDEHGDAVRDDPDWS